MMRTRRPSSAAQRSAIVSPKRPDPTTTRSVVMFSRSHRRRRFSLKLGRNIGGVPFRYVRKIPVLTMSRSGVLRRPNHGRPGLPAPGVARHEGPVHRAAAPPGHEPVAATDDHVAQVLSARDKAGAPELALQPELGGKKPPAAAPPEGARPDSVEAHRLADVQPAGSHLEHSGEKRVDIHHGPMTLAALAEDDRPP